MSGHTLSYSTFIHAVAGAVGGTTALTIFYPLDLARTRLQVDKQQTAHHAPRLLIDIATEEGISAWYSGLQPVLISLFSSNLIYFYVYNILKQLFLRDGDSSPVRDLLYAFIAGSINVVVTAPLWVVNTRLRLQGIRLKSTQHHSQHYRGMIHAMVTIARQEGVQALWSGTRASIILASNPSIQFMVYETLKRYAQHLFTSENLPGLVYFLMGAASKMVATVLTYPVQLIQSQLRAGYLQGIRHQGIVKLIINKIRNEGVKSLFRGLEAKLLQTVLTAATMFLVYEKIISLVFYVMKIQK